MAVEVVRESSSRRKKVRIWTDGLGAESKWEKTDYVNYLPRVMERLSKLLVFVYILNINIYIFVEYWESKNSASIVFTAGPKTIVDNRLGVSASNAIFIICVFLSGITQRKRERLWMGNTMSWFSP